MSGNRGLTVKQFWESLRGGGISVDQFGNGANLRRNEDGEQILSLDQLEALTQNNRDNMATRQFNHPSSGWQPQQHLEHEQILPTRKNTPQILPEKVAGVNEKVEEPVKTDYDPTNLTNKLAEIKMKAAMSGKDLGSVKEKVNNTQKIGVLANVVKSMSEQTSMECDYEGGSNWACYWRTPANKFTGFNKIYLSNPSCMGFAMMDKDNPSEEDRMVEIPYGHDLGEFTANLEDFFCKMLMEHLEIPEV